MGSPKLDWTEIDLSADPESVATLSLDCLLVILRVGISTPIKSQILRSLDWRLLGQISRAAAKLETKLIFIPTMNKIASHYIALQSEALDLTSFRDNCVGMLLKNIGLVKDIGVVKTKNELWGVEGSVSPGDGYPSSVIHLFEGDRSL